jgi:cyanophycinase
MFKNIFISILILCFVATSSNANGHLVIIGGGKRPERVMKKIIELAGGNQAKILVIPNASGVPLEVGPEQAEQFRELGAVNTDYLFVSRLDADNDSTLKKLENVTGIFLSGGDQRRLTETFLGTKFLERMREIYSDGGVISGTSAGAAVMSEIMITGDELKYENPKSAFATIEKENIKHTEGFGFVKSAIIDQHFIYRKRHNRLMSLVCENPELLGIGIDESTSIIVYPDDKLEVLGDWQVIIYDAKQSEINTSSKGLIGFAGMKTHLLLEGDKFCLVIREPVK